MTTAIDFVSVKSPGGQAASARRVTLYRGAAVLLTVGGVVIGEPFMDQFIALAIACLILAEMATIARAVEEIALQGERYEATCGQDGPKH